VKFNGHSIFFDWGTTTPNTIEWVAFHKDCEIETHPIQSGYQVLLTYGIFVTEQTGSIIHPNPIANHKFTPLYEGVRTVLQQPNFFKDGLSPTSRY